VQCCGLQAALTRPLGVIGTGVESNFSQYFSQEVALMETPKAPDAARGEMIFIGKSVVIKGELSCGEDLYIDGQVEGTIDPKGNRLTIGPNGRVKANVTACVVVVQGKLEGNIQASDRVDCRFLFQAVFSRLPISSAQCRPHNVQVSSCHTKYCLMRSLFRQLEVVVSPYVRVIPPPLSPQYMSFGNP
jgi:Polymer-forming cytoskeletal